LRDVSLPLRHHIRCRALPSRIHDQWLV
jgi:hypothetical protein